MNCSRGNVNTFKGRDLVNSVPKELWTKASVILQEGDEQNHPITLVLKWNWSTRWGYNSRTERLVQWEGESTTNHQVVESHGGQVGDHYVIFHTITIIAATGHMIFKIIFQTHDHQSKIKGRNHQKCSTNILNINKKSHGHGRIV